MLREPITIQNIMGLHTRAAAKLVALATQFESQIQLARNDQLADCKSVMSLILLGAKKGLTLELIISGADELEAREAILDLINRKFDEN
jgi:phosphocarrier protein